MTARRVLGLMAVGVLVMVSPSLRAQMPDVRQMSGIPMPAGDLQPGTVVVRVVRGGLSDNIVGQAVDLMVGGVSQTVKTDADGHAQFSGVAVGATARALALIDGVRVTSQSFPMPAAGGIRLLLAAGGGADAAAPAGPAPVAAVPGVAVIGGDSRVQIEFDDDSLTVFYILDIVNAGSAPIVPKTEVAFDLPLAAQQPNMLEGSSPQATLRGHRVTIAGPFAPGSTPVQIAFALPPGGSERFIEQAFPLAWARVQVIATKIPGLALSSAQLGSVSEVPGDTHSFMLGTGPTLAAGAVLNVALSGVPSRNRTGRYAALVLAVLVLLGGVWGAATASARTGDLARKAEVEQRRARLLAELVRLDKQFQAGGADTTRYQSRRTDLLNQLERVYGELDQHAGGSGEGLVA
ncbi:MAG: hypothetical protein WCP29_09010 [Acidobacteriota bacterium]